MKYKLMCVFWVLFPVLGFSQDVVIIREQDSGYVLKVDADSLVVPGVRYSRGDTISIDGQKKYDFEYTAIRAGLSFVAENDLRFGVVDVVGGNRYNIGADLWYIENSMPPDTVYPERPIVQGFRNQIEHRDSLTVIHSYVFTAADSLHMHVDCDVEREPLKRVNYTHSASAEHQVIYDSFSTVCNTDLQVEYLYFSQGDTVKTNTDFWPEWATREGRPTEIKYSNFENFNPDFWSNTWGELSYSVESNTLIIDLVEKSIARLQWNEIEASKNLRYTVTETLHSSHSTGVHIGGRHSEGEPKNSVETYVNKNGLGVSIFDDGTWINPHNFPFPWEPGDVVKYRVELIDDTIRAKIWQVDEPEPADWMQYSSAVIGNIPAGRFAIGSTGAGLYIIHDVEVEILTN